MSYLNSVTIIGFVGEDPEQRQARNNNGSKFTVLSVATQRSWKNTDDEWGAEDRVASRLGVPAAARRIRCTDDQERLARARRGQSRQHHVRTGHSLLPKYLGAV